VAGAGFAVGQSEPAHAAIHLTLAVAFGVWAQRLRPRPGGSELEPRLEALEIEVGRLRQALGETQERLDFAERVLARGRDRDRPDPER